MASYGELKPVLMEQARYLRLISNALCGTPSTAITSAGTGTIPAGYNSISIVATTVPATITMSDGSVYTFTVIGEEITQNAAEGGTLPAYTLTSGTIKWIGIKV